MIIQRSQPRRGSHGGASGPREPLSRRLPWRRSLTVLMALALLAAGCASDEAASPDDEATGTADLQPVSFGYQASLWGAPLILADITGRWEQAGLDVTSQRFSAGADVRDAIVAGSVDAGSIGSAPFVVAAAAGEMYAIAPAGYLGDTVSVVVGADTDIESVEDLAGKNVASLNGSITELIFFTKVLPAHGMTEDDIQPRNVSFDGHVAALTTGEVDAFVGLEPHISIAVAQGVGRKLIEFGEFDLLPNIFAVRRDFADQHEDTVVAILRSYFETTQWMEEESEEAAAALHEDFLEMGLELDLETTATSLERVDVNPVIDDTLRSYLDEQAKLLMEEGQLEELPDWDEVLRTDLQEQAITDYWADP